LPEDTLRVKYQGIDYKVYATGGKKKDENLDRYDVWNYKLYITANIKGKKRKSLLVAQSVYSDLKINIIFAGDIDGDGILDLILDISQNYNAYSPTLYLSKPADQKEVLKPIGGHTSFGC
jgi:hypothetical protein